MSKSAKTRRSYSYTQKIKILNELEKNGDNILAFSKKINIPEKTLSNWNKNKDKIKKLQKELHKRKHLGNTNIPALKKTLKKTYLNGF